MNFWINFWTFFFFASLAIFAVLAIVVSIGGFFNILSLFRTLTIHPNHQENGPHKSTPNRSSGLWEPQKSDEQA